MLLQLPQKESVCGGMVVKTFLKEAVDVEIRIGTGTRR